MIDYDSRFGLPRPPTSIQPWEHDVAPVSKVLLDVDSGKALKDYGQVASSALFRAAAKCFLFIWAMDIDGAVHVAFEEVLPPETSSGPPLLCGHPRRRRFPAHPAAEKKLGHPTLVSCGNARIAGELFLDECDRKLMWYINVASGRYCRDMQPTPDQCEAVRHYFETMIDETVILDEI